MRSHIDVKQDWQGRWFVQLSCCPMEWRMKLPDNFGAIFANAINNPMSQHNHWERFVKNLGFDNFVWLQSLGDGFQAGFDEIEDANKLAEALRALEEP